MCGAPPLLIAQGGTPLIHGEKPECFGHFGDTSLTFPHHCKMTFPGGLFGQESHPMSDFFGGTRDSQDSWIAILLGCPRKLGSMGYFTSLLGCIGVITSLPFTNFLGHPSSWWFHKGYFFYQPKHCIITGGNP